MNDTTTRDELPSGRFVLRLDPRLHGALRRAAAEAGLSLNEYCVRKLSGAGGDPSGPGWRAVARASATVDAGLVAVVAYGSWARGEAAAGSDVDVLVVVDREVPIVRALYHGWDEDPVAWEGRRVEPHFVHMPASGEKPSGTWAEVALDGVILFDRDLTVSRFLVGLRRRIVEGDMVRKEVHGQPYWLEASGHA